VACMLWNGTMLKRTNDDDFKKYKCGVNSELEISFILVSFGPIRNEI
jgi:hypothetical protein